MHVDPSGDAHNVVTAVLLAGTVTAVKDEQFIGQVMVQVCAWLMEAPTRREKKITIKSLIMHAENKQRFFISYSSI